MKIGMKYPVAALLSEEDDEVTYSDPMVLGRAVSSNNEFEAYDEKFYADDSVADANTAFKSGKTTLVVDDLNDEGYVFLLGHTSEESGVASITAQKIVASADDVAPYVGYGFYNRKKDKLGNVKYRAVFFKKVIFSEPSDDNETMGDSAKYNAPTITGTILRAVDGTWKEEITVDKESDAKTWLDHITGLDSVDEDDA